MSTQVDIPGYVAGAWLIDADRSTVSFQIRQGARICGCQGWYRRVEQAKSKQVHSRRPTDTGWGIHVCAR